MRPLHRAPVRTAVVAVVASLVLVGCGGSDDEPDAAATSAAPASDVEAADGDRIEAEGFSYAVPEGWEQNTDLQGAALTLAADMEDTDGFADNVNVVTDPTIVGIEGDELADALVKALENANVADVAVRDPFTIDGEEAVHTTGVFDLNGNKYVVEQYTLSVAEVGYVITFSHSESTTPEERDEVDQSILASWTWG